LGQGTYTLNNPITNITSYTTIEGGYDPITWVKTSAPGATRIFRTALNPEGGSCGTAYCGYLFKLAGFFPFSGFNL
jgi:hypothetical protein